MGTTPQLLAGLPTAITDRGYDSNAVLDLIAGTGHSPAFQAVHGELHDTRSAIG